MDPQKQSDERREHEREGKTEHPIQKERMPQATTSPAEPGKPGPRAPHAERGPGSAGADVGMSSDGGVAADPNDPATSPTGSGRR
jgi:hypothetical protein